MIKKLNPHVKNHTDLVSVFDFLSNCSDLDFYHTKNNSRIYITEVKDLVSMVKDSEMIYHFEENGDCHGIVIVWKSEGGGTTRYYLKVNAKDTSIAHDLITVVTWNFFEDLYMKIRKDSKFLYSAKSKGFKFIKSRGVQILLKRRKTLKVNLNGPRNNQTDSL